MDYIFNVRAYAKDTHRNEKKFNNPKGDWNMSRESKTYGVVITTKSGVKVIGIYANEHPTKSSIKFCLEYERKQELDKILNGNSGWRKKENIDKEIKKVDEEYCAAVLAVNRNDYKVKVLS